MQISNRILKSSQIMDTPMDRHDVESGPRVKLISLRLAASPQEGQFGERLDQVLLRSLALKATVAIRGADAVSGTFPDSWMPDVPPVVPDTHILRDDLIYACRNSVRTVLINAANAQFLRLYCAPHVIGEMGEHGHEWASGAGVPYEVFTRRWEEEYLPLIRLVPVDTANKQLLTLAERRRIAVLEGEDSDDVPSAVLALVLGAYYLSKDKTALRAVYGDAADLVKHDKWLEILKAGGNAGELGQMINALVGVVGLAGYGVVAGVRRLPPIAVIGGLGLFGAAAAVAYRRSSETSRQSLRAGFGRFATGVAELFAAYQMYTREFRQAAPPSPPWANLAAASSRDAALLRACLYSLSRSRASDRSALELSRVLPDIGTGRGEAKVRTALRASTLTSETWRGRWQVGRSMARPHSTPK
jgi:predicted nucleic acid-binding protein